MSIYTVVENLRKMVSSKEMELSAKRQDLRSEDAHVRTMAYPIVKILEPIVYELKVLLVEAELAAAAAGQHSWAVNPDRSGGAYTNEEINRENEWN